MDRKLRFLCIYVTLLWEYAEYIKSVCVVEKVVVLETRIYFQYFPGKCESILKQSSLFK